MLASMLWWRGSMRKLTVCAAHAVAWRNPMLCAHDNGFMVVDGYMVGAFEVYRHCWRQGCACVCTAPDACAHVVAPVCVAAWVAVRSGVVSVARRVFMQWAYSFSGREGGLGSDSSRRSLGQRAQCAALGGGTAGFQGRRRARVQCAARRVGGVHMVVSMQWGYGFSGVEGGLGCLSAPHAAQRVRWAAHNCAAGVHMGGGVLTCRSLRVRVPLTASQVKRWECSSVSVAARAASEAPPRCTRLHQVFEGGGVPACSVPPAAW